MFFDGSWWGIEGVDETSTSLVPSMMIITHAL